jgi:hypothetical protein
VPPRGLVRAGWLRVFVSSEEEVTPFGARAPTFPPRASCSQTSHPIIAPCKHPQPAMWPPTLKAVARGGSRHHARQRGWQPGTHRARQATRYGRASQGVLPPKLPPTPRPREATHAIPRVLHPGAIFLGTLGVRKQLPTVAPALWQLKPTSTPEPPQNQRTSKIKGMPGSGQLFFNVRVSP